MQDGEDIDINTVAITANSSGENEFGEEIEPMEVNTSTGLFDLDGLLTGGSGSGKLKLEPLERPSSVIKKRRDYIARCVAVDGRFAGFTKRPSSSSCLWLPRRKPEAPMYGTEEQGSILRIIASQGKDFDLVEKTKKENIYEKLGLVLDPPVSIIGAYSEAIVFGGSSDRDKLLFSVAGTQATGAVEEEGGGGEDEGDGNTLDPNANRTALKREKLDLVSGRRKRFVAKALVPPKHMSSFIEKAHEKDRKAAEAKQKRKDQVNMKLQGVKDASEPEAAGKDTSSEDVLKALDARTAHLRVYDPKYGKGRLTSTHNSKGRLLVPWEHVAHSYATLPGDRTV